MSLPPKWLSVRSPSKLLPIPDIDSGEIAAISLAIELHADLLLIDEVAGRQAASDRQLATARTAAVLFDAAQAGVIHDLRGVFERLLLTNFRVPRAVISELLRRHEHS